MKNILLILIALVGFTSVTEAQTLKQYKKEALKAFLEKDYYSALHHYDIVLDVDTSDMIYFYNHAESARQYDAYTIAEESYEKVASSPEHGNFPETDFWLASVKKTLGKYDEAKALFSKYVNNSTTKTANYLQAQKEIEDLSSWASDVISKPMDEIYIKHLGAEVNTGYNDFNPLLVDNTLYFTSLRFEKKKDTQLPTRFVSKVLTSTEGNMAKVIENGFNVEDKHTSNVSIKADGSRMYFTICDYAEDRSIACELYMRNKNTDDTWAEPIRLPDHINVAEATSTHPNISLDPTTNMERLYFVSDRAGGMGDKDIWYTDISADGTFGEAQNMTAINTPMDEVTPFYHTASQTLYFSSKGHQNLGGYDVFSVEKDGPIQHLGFPLNSSYNDFYYTLNDDETKAYFASNRQGSALLDESKEACCNDIYEVDIAPVVLNIIATTFNGRTKENLNGVNVQLLALDELLADENHPDNNLYKFAAAKGKKYVLTGTKPGYSSDKAFLSTEDIRSSQDLTAELYLTPLSLDLTALTYDELTKENVNGSTVKLVDCTGKHIFDLTHANKNDFLFEMVKPNSCYNLEVTHDVYFPKTVKVTIEDILEPTRLEEKIYLRKPVTKVTLDKYLPMPLYFDNDQPNPRTTMATTTKTYTETVDTYIARKSVFKEKYGRGLRGEARISSDSEIDYFFTDKVVKGKNVLEGFDDFLIRYLEQGNTAEIMIRGFASPIASSSYNDILTKRRISSILNFFRTCHNGVLAEYIANGKLKITEAPQGESLASEGVSDSPKDRKNSVYNPSASLERRVEIIEIKPIELRTEVKY